MTQSATYLHQSELWLLNGPFLEGEILKFDDYIHFQYTQVLEKRVKRLKMAVLAHFQEQALYWLNSSQQTKNQGIDAINNLYLEAKEMVLERDCLKWHKSYSPELIEALDDEDLKIILRLNDYKIGGKY
ncbi:hypothetical protein [Gallibacterium salpingitidis]|uniref:Uncharacterized protein n=1 Tax=Gallibacterium salpingitidis TaxID=505341 RepID=A0A1A7NYB5_9PAST|nr:hypothetical protein [Gallibacterium salpingitidis]OBW95202.1 hypothetical protein QS62_04235 [Gallibacterium salpingitidis]